MSQPFFSQTELKWKGSNIHPALQIFSHLRREYDFYVLLSQNIQTLQHLQMIYIL